MLDFYDDEFDTPIRAIRRSTSEVLTSRSDDEVKLRNKAARSLGREIVRDMTLYEVIQFLDGQ